MTDSGEGGHDPRPPVFTPLCDPLRWATPTGSGEGEETAHGGHVTCHAAPSCRLSHLLPPHPLRLALKKRAALDHHPREDVW